MHRSLSSATAHSECSAAAQFSSAFPAAAIAVLRDQAIPLRDDCDTQMHDDVVVEPEWDLSAQASPESKYQVDQRAVLDEIALDPQGELGDFAGGLVSLNRWQGSLSSFAALPGHRPVNQRLHLLTVVLSQFAGRGRSHHDYQLFLRVGKE